MDATKADLMRFGWMESAREEICHVEEMEQFMAKGDKKVIGIDMDADWMRFGLV